MSSRVPECEGGAPIKFIIMVSDSINPLWTYFEELKDGVQLKKLAPGKRAFANFC